MLIAAVSLVLAFLGGDPDGVVATAPATAVDLTAVARPVAPSAEGAARQAVDPHGLSMGAQIDRWLAGAPEAPTPFSSADGAFQDDHRVHGEVDVAVGTEGYRSYGAAISMPLGESGRLDLSYSQVENGYGVYPYGVLDPGFADSGYAFPGASRPGQALDYERRIARPDGPPQLRRFGRPIAASE